MEFSKLRDWMNSISKSKKYWTYYFLIQLPIAILAINGINIFHACAPEKPMTYIFPKSGDCDIYNWQNGDIIGSIKVYNTDMQNSLFSANITTTSTEYKTYSIEKSVFKIQTEHRSLQFQSFERKGEKYWYAKDKENYLVILQIKKITSPYITMKLENHNSVYYIFSELQENDFHYFQESDELTAYELLFLKCDVSISTGIFMQESN